MSDKKEEEEENKIPMQSPRSRSQAAMFMTSSPPVFISFDELMKASASVANMALAHEIAVDEDFKLEKLTPPSNSLENIIRQTMLTAFWDLLRADLTAEPPEFTHALSLLRDVRDEIKGLLLPSQDRIRARIDEEIDLDLVKQQLEKGTLDLRAYATFIIDLMGRLCAPVRDADIAALRAVADPIDLYREIFRVIDLMKMDMANFTIAQMRPYIQQQSVNYERNKFQQFVDAQTKLNIDGLAATKLWLCSVYRDLTVPGQPERHSPNIVLSKAYVELLYWDQNRLFPECCVMDETRLLQMGDTVRKLVLVATLSLVTSSTYKTASPDAAGLRDSVKSHCMALLEGVDGGALIGRREAIVDQIVLDVARDSEEHGADWSAERQREMREGLMQAFEAEHKVHKLLTSKILEFLVATLASNHRDPLQIPQGFSVVHAEVVRLSGQFMRIVAHNRNVFGPHYDDIIHSCLSSSGSQ